ASGGYYVSMAGRKVYAEPTTLTGSIGVYAAFPNVKEFGDKNGLKMEVIKRGEVKDGGSPFKEMTPQERQVWQDMVDGAYSAFLEVVAAARPLSKQQLRDENVVDEPRVGKDARGKEVHFHYVRRRADGGIFTAAQAKRLRLVDEIGR